MCTKQRFYNSSSSKFSKFIQGKSPLIQQLASVSLPKEKSKICPKLIERLSWNGPTVRVCCFMLACASTKTFVSRIHICQPSPKTAKKSLLAEKFVSSVTHYLRYHCIALLVLNNGTKWEWVVHTIPGCFTPPAMSPSSHCTGGWMVWRRENLLVLPGFGPCTVHSLASCCSNYTGPAPASTFIIKQ